MGGSFRSYAPMRRDRLLAALFAAVVAAVIWATFSALVWAEPHYAGAVVGIGAFAVVVAAALGAWRGPTLASEARGGASPWEGAARGARLTCAGYGLVLLLLTVGALFDGLGTTRQAIQGAWFMALMGTCAAMTVLSPGLLVGAGAGAVSYWLCGRSRRAEA